MQSSEGAVLQLLTPAPATTSSSDSRRPIWSAKPLVLYALIALLMLWPYHRSSIRVAGDLRFVIGGIIEAGNALKEGQFPVRVAPHLSLGMRYPIFQYYGNFPYTAGGLLFALGFGPYTAWRIMAFLTLLCGAWYTYRTAYRISRRHDASVLAGAIFLTAPYLFTDLNARGAYSEFMAFNLMPAAVYFTLRAFRSPMWRFVLGSAVVWTLIGLSHNITYVYGALFVGLFMLLQVGPRRKDFRRLLRLLAAAALHAVLIAWYLIPQLQTLPLLNINHETQSPWKEATDLNPLAILLAPVLTNTIPGAGTARLGLQVGWPILGAVALAALGIFLPRMRMGRRLDIVRLLLMFGIAFFMVWSPIDIWKNLPKLFWFVQFPYRLLIFVVLWGSILAACALGAWFPRKLPAWAALVVLILLGCSAASYLPSRAPLSRGLQREQLLKPDMGLGAEDNYLLNDLALSQTSEPRLDPESRRPPETAIEPAEKEMGPLPAMGANAARVQYGNRVRYTISTSRRAWLQLPVLYYPGMLDVRVNGHKQRYSNAGRYVAVRVPPGVTHVVVRYRGVVWANAVSLGGWLLVLITATYQVAKTPRCRAFAAWLWQVAGTLLKRSGWQPSPLTSLPYGAAIAAFGALTLGVVLPITWGWVSPFNSQNRYRIWASSDLDRDAYPPLNAFDQDPGTAWIPDKTSLPVLYVEPRRAGKLKRITLQARQTLLYEAWNHVRVVLLLHGQSVFDREIELPRAAYEVEQQIEIPSVLTDHIELHLSHPVSQTIEGKPVDPNATWPGYSEIRFEWE